ncbi:MAG: hypothetical protein QM739_04950 [Propionivibrio sp.]
MAALAQRRLQHGAHALVGYARQRQTDPFRIAAGGGQDVRRGVNGAAGSADDTFLGHAEQRAELRDDAFGKADEPARAAQFGARRDDQLESAPVRLQAVNLRVRADGDGQAGEQADAREFRLGLVVVDVVGADGLDLRRVAGLAGAQDDAQRLIAELLADEADELQAGIRRFHHHVEQHDGEVRVPGEHGARFGRRIGVQEFQRPAFERHALQRQRRRLVHARFVVDDEDAPDRVAVGMTGRRFVFESQEIVIRTA